MPMETKTRIPAIQANLVRILRFISCERASAFPGIETGLEPFMKA
jgi:hypothetical protein